MMAALETEQADTCGRRSTPAWLVMFALGTRTYLATRAVRHGQ